MNKIFKVIWNPATGSYSVASETAKSRGKKSGRSKLLISALVAGGLLSSFGASADNYTGQPTDYGDGSAGDGWVAIGKGSKANTFINTSGASTALGYDAIAEGEYSSAIGSKTLASGGASMAFGVSAKALGDRSVALGASSTATGDRSMALGRYAKTNGFTSLAVGDSSLADGEKTIALGNTAKAYEIMSIALGDNANASKEYSMALGASSAASAANAIAVGRNSAAAGVDSLALGRQSLASAANAITIGAESEAAENATAVGTKAKARGKNSLALGANSDSTGEGSVALGYTAAAAGASALALGQNAQASNTNTIALGQNSSASTANAIAIGTGSSAVGSNSLALGSSSSAGGNNSVAIGASSTADEDNVVSVGSGSAQRRIVNMAAGEISTDSKEAINGSQLYAISRSVADRLGGGADVASNGTIKGMSYKLKKRDFNNVGEALQYLDNETLHWDSAKGAFSASYIVKNADGTIASTVAENKIINVKDGDISATSKDAINGSQLKTTNDAVAANTTNIATNTTNITNLTDAVDSLGDDSLLWNATAGAFSAAHGTDATSKITNVKDGDLTAGSTDAVNGSQLYGLADSFTSYLGGGADISDAGVLTGPTYTIGGTDYNNVGDALAAINTSFSTSLGDALLWDATAKGGDGAFSAGRGKDNTASIITNVADGAISSTSSDAINGSQLYDTSKYIADTLGGDAEVNADGTITAPTYAIAGGSYSNVGDALEAIDTTLDDALLWDATANDGNGAFSAAHGKDKTASVITNVANGAISATSSDAINGSQLYTTNKYIADALGGDAEVNADGSITAPTYTIANAEYNNVGDALDALDDNALLWDATANDGAGAYNASHDGKASIITNVADGNIGEGSTDAINGSQLFNTNMLIQQNSEIINQLAGNTSETYIEDNGAGINYVRTNDNGLAFNDASASGIGAMAVGYNAVASGESSVAIGQGSSSSVDTGIALGSSSVSSRVIVKGSRDTSVSEEGVVIGYDTTDGELLGALSIGDDGKYRQIINVADGSEAHDAVTVRQLQNAIGAVATTPTKYFHANSTAEDSLAVGEDSLAMGAKTIVNGDAGIGIGLNTLVLTDAINGIAIGSNASANHANSIAMGSGSQTTRGAQTDYTAYNMDAPQNSVGEFSVGSEDGQRQITNVAAGSADTDAVNVSQLKSSEAGGVRYDTKADGSIDYSNITLGGGNGGTTRISNVSAGVNNNDAVNYAQLKQSVQETKQYTDQRMVEMDNKLSKTESKLSGGIASAMAMTGLPQAYTPGASMASIGGGTYNGESAVALGVSMVSANGRWVYKLQGSTNSQGEYSAALGAGIQW
ncbi:adhesin [Escherichia coli]|nr:adhesin [Escherichia coli]TZB49241.1 adhesin [Escherichia coli]